MNQALNRVYIFILIALTNPVFCQVNTSHVEVTTGSLFEEMINLEHLSQSPDPEYRIIQFSSFDHRSNLPGGKDWFANSDGFGNEPIPNFEMVRREPDEYGIGEYIIADIKGPGAIVRLWTAAISGNIKLYMNNNEVPLYDGEASTFFKRTYDIFSELDQIDTTRFNKTIYQRDASYTPIPFAEGIRIIWTGNLKDIHFYQVQMKLYPKGTSVVSFTPSDIARYANTIDHVTHVLENPDSYYSAGSDKSEILFETNLAAGEKREVVRLTGPGAIIRFTLHLNEKNAEHALKQTLLRIFFDDLPSAHVQSPAGDFFGASPGVNPYVSLPFTVHPDGKMVCRFVMPFERSAIIQLENWGNQEISVYGSIQSKEYKWNERSMYFTARWRVNHNLTASRENVIDLPFLIAFGRGLYVGTTSFLLNPCPVPTSSGNWWGEGDEKVFIDNDFNPSIFGTGSEDFYNYSWSSPDIFYFPYCGQPRNDGPGNRGFIANYRWHIPDAIPYKENIRFYMELYSHLTTPGLTYARLSYHYTQPGTIDDHIPVTREDLRVLELPDNWQPVASRGSRNSVFFEAEVIINDTINTKLKSGNIWSGSQLLVWSPQQQGERKNFSIPVDNPGEYRVYITAAHTPASGRILVILNNQLADYHSHTEVIDLYAPYRIVSRNYFLARSNLNKGNQILTLEYNGSEEKIKDPEIGIDFIWIQKLE